ncbi:MAG: hypothetical protein M3R62_03165 [Acidobacteriota bacterium]|nr:hypothetical protein [Acidobacteriota bacterium]
MIHATKPDFFQLSPALAYEEGTLPNGQHFIRIGSLGPKEFFTIQLLSYRTEARALNVRSKEGPGKLINIRLHVQLRLWQRALRAILILLGSAVALYWLIFLLIRLWSVMVYA